MFLAQEQEVVITVAAWLVTSKSVKLRTQGKVCHRCLSVRELRFGSGSLSKSVRRA